MPNKKYAKEWLELARKHRLTAQLLFEADHFTDIIGIELQQSIERYLKALLAYYSIKIPRSHDLVEIYKYLGDNLILDDEQLEMLDVATTYFTDTRYPGNYYYNPDMKEIQKILSFANDFDSIISSKVNISV